MQPAAPSQPKSDISDFGQSLKATELGKPEFGCQRGVVVSRKIGNFGCWRKDAIGLAWYGRLNQKARPPLIRRFQPRFSKTGYEHPHSQPRAGGVVRLKVKHIDNAQKTIRVE